jgi:acyl-coenzyme A synthetase/AMP-(fatty) acid ligase
MDNFILNYNLDSKEDSQILIFLEDFQTKKKLRFTTSGTTGKPKKIFHDLHTVKKNIKISEKFQNCVWGLTYPPDKIAASQVILQAFLNNSKIVNLYKKPTKVVVNLFQDYKITHISATPTFYRLLLDEINIFENVRQVTLGGESVDSIIIEKIKKSFPNAQIRNIYASTEFGTLFASENEYFEYNESLKKIISINELQIFVRDDLKLHPTGDLVEWIDNNRFRIIGRVSNMINVGGYKINPMKIEQTLNNLPYIKNSLVFSQSNSVMGNVVAANILLEFEVTKNQIKKDLKDSLEKWETPIIINFVESLDLTETGKLSRK